MNLITHTLMAMLRILDGSSEHVANARRKVDQNPICDCSRSNQMPLIDNKKNILTCAPVSEIPSNLIT